MVLKEFKAVFVDIMFVVPIIVGDNCCTRTSDNCCTSTRWVFGGGKDWEYV